MREVIMFSFESSPVVFLGNIGNSSETDQQEQIWAADHNLNIFKIYRKITVERNVLNLTNKKAEACIDWLNNCYCIHSRGGGRVHT